MTTYSPINCNYYDFILDLSTKKQIVNIRYISDINTETLENGFISDVYTKDKAEYLVLNNSIRVRLDKIISINDKKLEKQSCSIN